jgi:hypothetical protein
MLLGFVAFDLVDVAFVDLPAAPTIAAALRLSTICP